PESLLTSREGGSFAAFSTNTVSSTGRAERGASSSLADHHGSDLSHDDVSLHPGVNAALIMVHAYLFVFGVGALTRYDQAHRQCLRQRGAFRCRRQTQNVVEFRDEPAAELVDLGERVCFPTVIERDELLAVSKADWVWREVPCAGFPVFQELGE